MNLDSLTPYVGHISYCFILMSYMVRKIFMLRLLAIFAGVEKAEFKVVQTPSPRNHPPGGGFARS